MSTQDLQTYVNNCAKITRDYKHLHRQHLTVFAAFQKLQRASKDLVRCTRSIQSQLGEQNTEELKQMYEEQERIAQDIHLMNSDSSNSSYEPNIHHDDVALIKHVKNYLKNPETKPLKFCSFYGTKSLDDGTTSLEDIVVFSDSSLNIDKPFKHMLNQLVTKLKWYDYIFHYLIPGMFEFNELKSLSRLKSNSYNPCLVIPCINDTFFHDFVQKVNQQEQDPDPNLRVKIIRPAYMNKYDYYCPVFDDNQNVLLHNAPSTIGSLSTVDRLYLSSTEDTQLKLESSITLKFFTNGTFENSENSVVEINVNVTPSQGIKTLHDGKNSTVNTFKEYAFFHRPFVVNDETQYDYTNMALACVRQYQLMIIQVAEIWRQGCRRLRNAINDSQSVKVFLEDKS